MRPQQRRRDFKGEVHGRRVESSRTTTPIVDASGWRASMLLIQLEFKRSGNDVSYFPILVNR